MDSLGYPQRTDPQLRQRVLRTLPATLDDSLSVWRTSDGSWIVVYPGLDPDPQPEVFGLFKNATVSVLSWKRIGSGWAGLQELLVQLESEASRRPLTPIRQLRRPFSAPDPRALIY